MVALLLTLCSRPAMAQDEKVKLSEKDFTTYEQLRASKALADYKNMFAHDKTKKEAIEVEWQKALGKVNWTSEQYDVANSTVIQALDALAGLERPDDAENARSTLAEMDPATVALVKAHKNDHLASSELEKRAAEQVRAEQDRAKRGTPPTADQLLGTWVVDIDATIESIADGLGEEIKKKIRDDMQPKLADTSYTFGPGDSISASSKRAGQISTEAGTYRIEGNELVFKYKIGQREREMKMGVGMKDGKLRIGYMGVYTAFKKQ